jgi:hypothetical protein
MALIIHYHYVHGVVKASLILKQSFLCVQLIDNNSFTYSDYMLSLGAQAMTSFRSGLQPV